MVYMGSKRRIAKYILPIILEGRTDGQWYVEPFCGGCNSINKVDGNRIASDNNKYLIALYKALQNGWMPKEYYTKEEYYYTKANMDLIEPHDVGYIGFVCSFRGKFFNGYCGITNTENGSIRNYQKEKRNGILKDINLMKDVCFLNKDYCKITLPSCCIIYCDPPYQGTTTYKTGEFDHDSFWQWCRDKVNEGHKVFVSEYNAPDDFECVWEMDIKDTLSTKKTHIKTEKLFTYKNK